MQYKMEHTPEFMEYKLQKFRKKLLGKTNPNSNRAIHKMMGKLMTPIYGDRLILEGMLDVLECRKRYVATAIGLKYALWTGIGAYFNLYKPLHTLLEKLF